MKAMLLTLLSQDYGALVLALALLLVAALGAWRLRRRGLRLACAFIALGALVLTGGAASQLWRSKGVAEDYPPPGQLVDVGGHRMHVLAEGPQAGPTLVLFAGGHVDGLPVWRFHTALRDSMRSVLIDRPGTGWSDPGPFPRTTAREAREIMAALEAAGESGPYIFAGHSFGGLLAANIARRYPGRTASLVLLDPTPLDVVFYGIDRRGLGGMKDLLLKQGLLRAFGFYRMPPPAPAPTTDDSGLVTIAQPLALWRQLSTRPRSPLAGASIFEELAADSLIPRAFDTVVYDGELGDLPVYLIAPDEDPTTAPYAQQVADDGAEAARFVAFLKEARERYLALSSNSQRIVAPAGTGHNFPDQAPDWLIAQLRRIAEESAADWRYRQLTSAWPGPYGGVPPVQLATPENLATAYRRALASARQSVLSITDNPAPPSFANTVLALEKSRQPLDRVQALLRIFTTTASNDRWRALTAELAPLGAAFNDELAHDPQLFRRLQALYESRNSLKLDATQARLLTVRYEDFVHRGGALDADAKARLRTINGRLAELRTRFQQNVMAEEAALVVFAEREAELAGLTAEQIAAARSEAERRGQPQAWAIPIRRPTVWPVLTRGENRVLRERVWRSWVGRGANAGEHDNRPVINEILRLRGEKAALLGYESFAHYQTAARMAGTPERALALLTRTWDALAAPMAAETKALQALAGDTPLAPWDRRYYEERSRQQRLAYDSDAVLPYLALENVVSAMTFAAEEVFELTFREIEGIPTVSETIRVLEASRDGEVLGLIYLDLYQRDGKGPSSWASQYRPYADYAQRQLPLVALHSAVQPPAPGKATLVPWERANVIFHEFGHTLHTLQNRARYPSLGALAMPWDFIEVPSLLNERWLPDRDLLQRIMTHHETGEPMPGALVDRLMAAQQDARVFSVGYPYLASALVDLRLHLLADGRALDAVAEERAILEDIGLPPSFDLTLYAPHAFHTFSREYAAGMYTYLWSDSYAADAAEAFLEAPGGLYDKDVARRWRKEVLERGNTVPAAEAYEAFRGGPPDWGALLRRFDLLTTGGA
ncbi:alpha/beta fold hydrolase [Pseudohaliea sp.]|uniref:alpha/beta fold hydrolase n=1 Tax=Pseudohaliea sp. TaxID=2740289 RepID=UPI0032EB4DDA